MSIEVSPRSRMRAIAGEVAQGMQTITASRAGGQLTEQVGLILAREATGKVDCVRKIRHGYEIQDVQRVGSLPS